MGAGQVGGSVTRSCPRDISISIKILPNYRFRCNKSDKTM